MKDIGIGHSNSPASKHLLRILDMGGQITKAPIGISIMLNGLRYYSLEVTMDKNCYIIQGYEQEAVTLYDTTMFILADKSPVAKKIIIEKTK